MRTASIPNAHTVWDGTQAFFHVVGSGGRQLTYQWQRDGVDIPGATREWLVLPKVSLADNGARFTVVLRNAAGAVTSGAATLTVVAASTAAQESHARLLGLALEFTGAAFAPELLLADGGTFLAPSAVCSSGSVSGTINGAVPVTGQKAPGSGTLAATFSACAAEGSIYTGSSSMTYTASADFATFVASGSASGMRVTRMLGGSAATDTTADCNIALSSARTVSNGDETSTVTLAPGSGATLRNELTGRTATFDTGSLSFSVVTAAQGGANALPKQTRWSYDSLRFTVAGIPYVATGALQINFGNGSATNSGEVRIQSNGTTIARIYATSQGVFFDVNGTAQPW